MIEIIYIVGLVVLFLVFRILYHYGSYWRFKALKESGEYNAEQIEKLEEKFK